MKKWNATYVIKMADKEMKSITQIDAADFEDAMQTASTYKNMFRRGSDVKINSLVEVGEERRPIGFGA